VKKIKQPSSSSSQAQELTDERQIAQAFYNAFKSPNGRLVYNWLEGQYNNSSSFVPGEPETTAYNEGCRAVFLQIKHNLEYWEEKGKEL
jgi:hypothetical protein